MTHGECEDCGEPVDGLRPGERGICVNCAKLLISQLPTKKRHGVDRRQNAFSKYHSTPTEIDGILFDSRKEANRYCELKLLQRGGLIKDLRTQVEFPLLVNGVKVCSYFADFTYYDHASASEVVEDAKGFRTAIYKLKKQLLFACLGITIQEV